MVQAKNTNQQVNGITVIECPTIDEAPIGKMILIDNGFTGDAIVT
jgi:hypothetical protein